MAFDQQQIDERFRLLVPITNLATPYQNQILETAQWLPYARGDRVFRAGERDAFSYYVLDGTIELYANEELIKTVVGGEAASFHPLAQLQPRQMTAIAKTDVDVLRINRSLLDKLLVVDTARNQPLAAPPAIEVAEFETALTTDWLTAILRSELFMRIPPANIQVLLSKFETVEVKAGDFVIRQDEPGDYYYAIQSGSCEVTRRTSKGRREIRLATLLAGDTFGEEALVADAKRNASVRMVTDGVLARLTKEMFIDLIKAPVLKRVELAEARELVAAGAQWLDVRFEEEHASDGLSGSLNIPLNVLRMRSKELDPKAKYIAYCDGSARSSTAAFILTEMGFDAYYVDADPRTGPRGSATTPTQADTIEEAQPADQSATGPSAVALDPDTTIDCDIRASALAAELEQANFKIDEARRLMVEAQRVKEEAKHLVAEQLRVERDQLAKQTQQVHAELAQAQQAQQTRLQSIEQKLQADREQLAQEAARAKALIADAERLRHQLAEEKSAADAEAERRHQNHEQRLRDMEQAAEQRLRDKESALQSIYHRNAEELAQLQTEHAAAAADLATQREQVVLDDTISRQRLEAAVKLESDLKTAAEQAVHDIEQRERELRTRLDRELRAERARLEEEFARNADQLQQARRNNEQANAARAAAASEASRIIAEFKENHAQLRAEEESRLQQEKAALRMEADRIQALLDDARRAQHEAEQAQAETEFELARLKQAERKPTRVAAADDTRLQDQIVAVEQRAAAAAARVRSASAVTDAAETEQRSNIEKLERTYQNAHELSALLQSELSEWIESQEQMQNSDDLRKLLARQQEASARIKQRAKRARDDSARHDQALLDEIAAQVRK